MPAQPGMPRGEPGEGTRRFRTRDSPVPRGRRLRSPDAGPVPGKGCPAEGVAYLCLPTGLPGPSCGLEPAV